MKIEDNLMREFDQCFREILPKTDLRCKISPHHFIIALLFSFLRDSKTHSLEGLRRQLCFFTNTKINRSSFWERLNTKKLHRSLEELYIALFHKISASAKYNPSLLKEIGVDRILLIDATENTLPSKAAPIFPGNHLNDSSIKLHLCVDLLNGLPVFSELTPARTHDSQIFPPPQEMQKTLFLFDLAYWDKRRFEEIEMNGGFFLSRVKAGSALFISEVIKGADKNMCMDRLFYFDWKTKRAKVVELRGYFEKDKNQRSYRIIGFWNKEEKCYHWYITNLKGEAALIYPIYRLRWQIELIFKGEKQSLLLDEIPSSKKYIILNLMNISKIAYLFACFIMFESRKKLKPNQQFATSFQRVCKVLAILSESFFRTLSSPSNKGFRDLLEKIHFFALDVIDPNYKRRQTSLDTVFTMISDSS